MYKLSASGYRNFASVQASVLERHYSVHQCWCACLNVTGDTICNLSLLNKKFRFFFILLSGYFYQLKATRHI